MAQMWLLTSGEEIAKKMQEHIGAKSKFLCFCSFSKHFLVNQNFGYYIKIIFYEAISCQYRNNNATAHCTDSFAPLCMLSTYQ